MADPRSPGGSVANNFGKPGTLLHIPHTGGGCAGHPPSPRRQPQKARQSENDKERPPPKTRHQNAAEKNPHRRSKGLPRSDNGIGEAAPVLHKIVGGDLTVTRISHMPANSKDY